MRITKNLVMSFLAAVGISALSGCSSKSSGGGGGGGPQPPNSGDGTPKTEIKVGEDFIFDAETSASNTDFPGNAKGFGLKRSIILIVDEKADLNVASESLALGGSCGDGEVNYALINDSSSTRVSTVPLDGTFKVVQVPNFPGLTEPGRYTLSAYVGTDSKCQVSVVATMGIRSSNSSGQAGLDDGASGGGGGSDGSDGADDAGGDDPDVAQPTMPLQGSWDIKSPYSQFRGDGYYDVTEAFTVSNAGMIRFSRKATSGRVVNQEEDYEASLTFDEATTPKRLLQQVTMMHHYGITGLDVGSSLYCIYQVPAGGDLQLRCSMFSYPMDFFANAFWYQQAS